MAPPRASARPQRRALKIVVTGSFGAGKTTLIESISEIEVLSTEREVTSPAEMCKQRTTVAMDFGRLSIDDDLALYLFGTPGQQRFDFMWEILAEGMLGFVVVVDGADPASFEQAADILSFFESAADVPYVVAVNKVAADDDEAIDRVRSTLDIPARVRIAACDARERESTKTVLVALLEAVLDDIAEPVDISA